MKCFLTTHLEDIEYSEDRGNSFYILRSVNEKILKYLHPYKNSFNIEKGRQMFSHFKIRFQIATYITTGKVLNFLEKIVITKQSF